MIKDSSDVERVIIDQAKVEEEIQRLEERQIADWEEKKFNLFFYGFGSIANKSLETIANTTTNHGAFSNRINKVYLYDNDSQKCSKIDSVVKQLERQLVDVISYSKNRIEEKLKEKEQFNIFFLTAARVDYKDRYESAEGNIPIIDEIAPLFPEDYKGLVCIVTNLPEILSYKLALKSKLKPEKIFGFSHVDKYRLDSAIKMLLEKEENLEKKENHKRFVASTAFLIGTHDKPVCIFNNAKVIYSENGKIIQDSIEKIFNKEEIEGIKDYIAEKPKTLYNLGVKAKIPTSAIETGGAVNELVSHIIMNKLQIVNISFPFKYENFPFMYIEVPAFFDKGKPEIFDINLKNITDEDNDEINDALKKLYNYNVKFGYVDLERKITIDLKSAKTLDMVSQIIREKYIDSRFKEEKDIFNIIRQKYIVPRSKREDDEVFKRVKQKYLAKIKK